MEATPDPSPSPKAQFYAQIDAAVDAAVAGAHPDEAHIVERIRAHVATVESLIEDLSGTPDMVTEYYSPPSGGPVQERLVNAHTGEVVVTR